MKNVFLTIIATVALLLCSCKSEVTQDALIGWDISFGINIFSFLSHEPGLTHSQIDSICAVVAKENEYTELGDNHIILHDQKSKNDVTKIASDFANSVDARIKGLWGDTVKVDNHYSSLQVAFDADFGSKTETIAIFTYK